MRNFIEKFSQIDRCAPFVALFNNRLDMINGLALAVASAVKNYFGGSISSIVNVCSMVICGLSPSPIGSDACTCIVYLWSYFSVRPASGSNATKRRSGLSTPRFRNQLSGWGAVQFWPVFWAAAAFITRLSSLIGSRPLPGRIYSEVW